MIDFQHSRDREVVARIIDDRPWADVNPYASHFHGEPSSDHATYERERANRQRKVLTQADAILALASSAPAESESPKHIVATPTPDESGLREALRAEIINTPETADFMAGVPLEAAHQRERWGSDHDAGKSPEDWFWLLGYLGQKALRAQNAGDTEKALHHTISTAAALANWHAAISGTHTAMRPGIKPPALATNGGAS